MWAGEHAARPSRATTAQHDDAQGSTLGLRLGGTAKARLFDSSTLREVNSERRHSMLCHALDPDFGNLLVTDIDVEGLSRMAMDA